MVDGCKFGNRDSVTGSSREPRKYKEDGLYLKHIGTVIFVSVFSLLISLVSQEAVAGDKSANRKTFTNPIGMKFVLIPAGSFMMGSPPDEPGRGDDERQHRVTLTKGFYMGVTEVTQRQWRQIMGNNPSHFRHCGADCPVEFVSWNDCQQFVQHLNQ